jgi:hypothetical protein
MWTPTLPLDQSTGNLKLDMGVTEFYMDANFAIGPIDWQYELDQGITEFYVDASFAVGPFVTQLELDQLSLSFTWMPTFPLTGN